MRALVLATIAATMLIGASASAQTPAPLFPYGLDPYKPSDAEILRRYGSALVAQTPLLELRKLDPYKPSEAALLRGIGGGIPLWGFWSPMWPLGGPTMSPYWPGGVASQPPVVVIIADDESSAGDVVPQSTVLQRAVPQSAVAGPPPAGGGDVVSVPAPVRNDGLWISYAGARWGSAGRAVPIDPSTFIQIGEYRGFPVFSREGSGADVIYVPTARGLAAPFRMMRESPPANVPGEPRPLASRSDRASD